VGKNYQTHVFRGEQRIEKLYCPARQNFGAFLSLFTQSAHPGPVAGTFRDFTLTGGGSVTELFVHDADAKTYSSINIVTSAGTSPLGATHVIANNIHDIY